MPNFKLVTVAVLSFSLLISCNRGGGSDQSSTAASIAESPNCLDVRTYSNPITLTGYANYQYRPVAVTNSSQGIIFGLSGNPVWAVIPYAEIAVINAGGEIVQCGNTDESGNFSLQVDKNMGALRVRVFSRAFNSKLKLSILEDTNFNAPYAIEASVTAGNDPVGGIPVVAYARLSQSAKLEGGAFHILASIYKANKYIRTQIADNNWTAEKVTVFWKAGFNPYSYFGYPNNLLSFYKPGERKLFILGGKDGNVSQIDTDHFDTSVIVHEYGHFLEDVYGKTDSPGGYHNGDAVIDPRLAWSEGFANFFQAASQGTNYYLDTAGFCNDSQEAGACAQNVYFKLNEDGTSTLFDRSTAAGEGNFRELSITRTLFKMISASSSSHPYGAGLPFKEIWNVFVDSVNGFHSSGKVFRTIHLLTSRLDQIVSSSYPSNVTFWNAVLNNEQQQKTFKEYNNTFSETTFNSCTFRDLSPVADKTVCYGSSCPINKMSNQLRSNDFYRLDVTQSDIDANATVQIAYFQCNAAVTNATAASDSGCPTATNVDLDLYLYKQGYTYADELLEKEKGIQSTDVVKKSARVFASFESGSESITLGQLTPGVYLLNVKASTYGKTSAAVGVNAKYRVQKINGSTQRDLCPQN